MKHFILTTTLVLSLAALTGCVAQKQWRTQISSSVPAAKTPGANTVEDRFVIPNDPNEKRFYSLAFVEFKNDGQLWDPRQLEAAKKAIDDADKLSGHRALAITFIHGWKNNARQVNNNVHDFRVQLNNIAAQYCPERNPSGKPEGDRQHCGVVGIYLAWSGDLVTRDFNTLRTLSYFNRRNTAADVALNKQAANNQTTSKQTAARAASSPLGMALRDIMKQVKSGEGRDKNHSVVVGHSFGGLILEYAIQSQLEQIGKELHDELGKNQSSEIAKLPALENFADLVVLINQAAPADHAVETLSQYRADLQQVRLLWPPKRQDCSAGDTSPDCVGMTHPLLLSVSSESDLATRTFLPIAETIAPPKDRPRVLPPDVHLPDGLDVKKVFTTAAGHTPQLYSHDLRKCVPGQDCSPCSNKDNGDNLPVEIHLPAYAPGNTEQNTVQHIKYCLVPDAKAWNRTPYWIFHIPSEVVPDHGTIFTPRFTEFLTAFLPTTEVFTQENRPAVQRLYRISDAQQPK